MKTRILTALVLIPFALGIVFYLPNEGFAVLVAAILGIGAWEWGGFLRSSSQVRIAYLVLNLAGFGLIWLCLDNLSFNALLLSVALLWWCLASVWVVIYPRGFGSGQPNRLMVAVTGLLVLLPCFMAMVALHGRGDNGPWQLMVVVAAMWAADSGAYFAGRFLGRHKLAPRVSPGKTWEGALGGMIAGVLLIYAGGHWIYELDAASMQPFLVMGALVIALSIIGDLTESMFKRATNIKDSGNLFPGHGGIMDRLDSLTAAAPCFLLGLQLLGL